MSWQEINRFELQAIRKLLMLDVAEAAEYIGNVSVRSWQYWESGERSIPADVEIEMYALVSQRNEIIGEIFSAEDDEEDRSQKWYPTFESFTVDYPGHTKTWWRLHQSVLSYLFCEGGEIELQEGIEVDKKSAIYKFFSRTRENDLENQQMEKIFAKRRPSLLEKANNKKDE